MSEAILETRNLVKDFKGFRAVDGVSLTVRRGTIHALIGPNGAGKTTCFNLLTKFLSPTEGSISFEGVDITGRDAADVARMGIVRSFQISSVFTHLSVLENVRVALQRTRNDSFFFWRSERSLNELNGKARELIDAVGLIGVAHVRAGDLSYGRKRALEIATTLALEPQMLLLDEPMAGLGHEDVDRIVELIRRISQGRTTLLVEHNLSVVASLSQTITVLARGKVLAEGDYDTVSKDPLVIEAYLGAGHE